ncbi:MAG: dTDP-4-dehydrorhamnose 3,5-epimerase family protein [Planctomycetales bacterium]|nr:dTDP-4-dehydrorhamnose 3,5-epimerase family protein [Planctomycetales bacterium]
MLFTATEINGIWLVDLERRQDDRGFFARAWCAREFNELGLVASLSQLNLAYTRHRGTIRGLHFQRPPHAETKLVRCLRGAAWVVAVDTRRDSPTHQQYLGVELTQENRRLLYVPAGLAQGYQTLVDDTELLYHMSTHYVPEAAAGYRFDDPAFAIHWPQPRTLLSPRDRSWPDYQ